MRLACFVALLICALPLASRGAAVRDEDLQRRFTAGALALEAGDYSEAAAIFRFLLGRTESPRVRLELARSLFYLEQYDEARAIFRGVQLERETPWQVRDNIDHFLREIDARVGYAKFSVSLASDSNPRNLSSQREFVVAGIRVRYTPPEDNHRVTGLRYLVQVQQPLSASRGLDGYLVGSLLDYPGSSVDRLTVDAGVLGRDMLNARIPIKVGMEVGTFGKRLLYRMPYASLLPVLAASDYRQVSAELKVGRVDFPGAAQLDATLKSATVTAGQRFSDTLTVAVTGGADYSQAREAPYSYRALKFGPAASWLLPGPAVMIKGDFIFELRSYADTDPLFGARRRDWKHRIDASLTKKEWRWRNYTPSLVFSLEKNASNLAFYEYRKINLSLQVE